MQCLSTRMQVIAANLLESAANAKPAGLNSSILLVRTSDYIASSYSRSKKGVGKYFVQVARFDPSKGIPDVIKSYAEFCRLLSIESNVKDNDSVPQLLM